MGFVYSYNRCSHVSQNLERGEDTINKWAEAHGFSVKESFTDKQTGTNFDRPGYKELKKTLINNAELYEQFRKKEGAKNRDYDTVIIPEFDRLGRSEDTKKELNELKSLGCRLIFIDIPLTWENTEKYDDEMARVVINLTTDLIIQIYDLLARAEYDRKVKRQKEGYEQLRTRGEWNMMGRPKKMLRSDFYREYKMVLSGEQRPKDVINKYKLSQGAYYRYRKDYEEHNGIIDNQMEEEDNQQYKKQVRLRLRKDVNNAK